jgi:hypothetical protein
MTDAPRGDGTGPLIQDEGIGSGGTSYPDSPTAPILVPESDTHTPPPPIGLNWEILSDHLGVDRRTLEFGGSIVLTGEYFPEEGYYFDPVTLMGHSVDVGDRALRHGYFLGDLVVRDLHVDLPLQVGRPKPGVSIVRMERGPIIGLFSGRPAAQRVKTLILQSALGSGITLEDGPVGTEIRVERPELPGRVATVIASQGGAIISIGGVPVRWSQRAGGPMATSPGLPAAEADSTRGGTGVASDSEAGAEEWGSSDEFSPL